MAGDFNDDTGLCYPDRCRLVLPRQVLGVLTQIGAGSCTFYPDRCWEFTQIGAGRVSPQEFLVGVIRECHFIRKGAGKVLIVLLTY